MIAQVGVQNWDFFGCHLLFSKIAQAGRRTWDLLVFVYFLSLKQRHRPLGYCAPISNDSSLSLEFADILGW